MIMVGISHNNGGEASVFKQRRVGRPRFFLDINLRLSAEEPLGDLTARVLKHGLDVLRIKVVEQK
jgi:hypothetical protein